MDSKQLVALWYGGVGLVIARVVLGVSGVTIGMWAGVVLVALIVPIVQARRHVRAERQLVSVGAALLVGHLVLGAVLVGEWRAQSVVAVATRAVATSDSLSTIAPETTPFDETIVGKVLALADEAKIAVAPHSHAPFQTAPSAGPAASGVLSEKDGAGRSDEACQPSQRDGEARLQRSDPREVGCAAEANQNPKQLGQPHRTVARPPESGKPVVASSQKK